MAGAIVQGHLSSVEEHWYVPASLWFHGTIERPSKDPHFRLVASLLKPAIVWCLGAMRPPPRQHPTDKGARVTAFHASRFQSYDSFHGRTGRWPYHLEDFSGAHPGLPQGAKRGHGDVQHQHNHENDCILSSKTPPASQYQEQAPSTGYLPDHPSFRSRTFGGSAQLYHTEGGGLRADGLITSDDFEWQDTLSSPSSSFSDVEMSPTPPPPPKFELEENQEVDEESKSSSPSGVNEEQTPLKTSRYLREMDRRIILRRLANGEKQAALAREYHVSRSTICNLFKQRQAVWARRDENPLSLHPKKSRRKHLLLAKPSGQKTQEAPLTTSVSPAVNYTKGTLVEVKSRALSLLLTTVRDLDTSPTDFQRCRARAIRLLLEESLALLADKRFRLVWDRPQELDTIQPARPLYAVSLERQDLTMLEAFQSIAPESRSISFWPSRDGHRRRESLRPPISSLESYDVVLLDVNTDSAELVCTAIRMLRGCGAQESRIFLVSLFVSSCVVPRIHHEHPEVKVSTACVDAEHVYSYRPSLQELESSSRMFLERFHTLEC